MLYIDGISNCKGNSTGAILTGENEIIVEQFLFFAFKASNNQAKYRALITRLRLGKELKVWYLAIKGDY